MLAYQLKEVLSLIPEAAELTKSASFDQYYPTDSKDSALASYLQLGYNVRVLNSPASSLAHVNIDKIVKAASLYNVADEGNRLILLMIDRAKNAQMTKAASELSIDKPRISDLEDAVSGMYPDLVKAASIASSLEDEGIPLTGSLARYAGKGFLNKQAAVNALDHRYSLTGEDQYSALSKLVKGSDGGSWAQESIVKLASMITDLDATYNLHYKGFNFYKEALDLEKKADDAVLVNLGSESVPYSKIRSYGIDSIGKLIGQDVANELEGDPVHDKSILETLPLDLQKLLAAVLKNVA